MGLDFLNASINHIAASIIGTLTTFKALLGALLEPIFLLRDYEQPGDLTARSTQLEECKQFPLGFV